MNIQHILEKFSGSKFSKVGLLLKSAVETDYTAHFREILPWGKILLLKSTVANDYTAHPGEILLGGYD